MTINSQCIQIVHKVLSFTNVNFVFFFDFVNKDNFMNILGIFFENLQIFCEKRNLKLFTVSSNSDMLEKLQYA